MTDDVDEMGPAGKLLAIYLQDHRAGAAAGLRLIHRCRSQASGQRAEMLAWLESSTDEDRRSLDTIMDGLGIRPARIKTTLSLVAERLGRLKLNGHLWKRSPLSPLMEFEALAAAVTTKRDLWRTLGSNTGLHGGLDTTELNRLEARATGQLERIEEHHTIAAREAFAAV